jgi:hypothetical protein
MLKGINLCPMTLSTESRSQSEFLVLRPLPVAVLVAVSTNPESTENGKKFNMPIAYMETLIQTCDELEVSIHESKCQNEQLLQQVGLFPTFS